MSTSARRDDRAGAGLGRRVTQRVRATAAWLDRIQQRHRVVAVAVAVLRKFTEDRSANLASMVAFWAVFSVFPLLLVFVTVLGYVVPADVQREVLRNLGVLFPMVTPSTVSTLSGPPWALVVGVVTALWSGSSVVVCLHEAFDSVWEVPFPERPTLVGRLRRGLVVLFTIGLGLIVSTVISGLVTGVASGLGLGWATRLLGQLLAMALDVGLFVAAFRMLTSRELATRQILPGALMSGLVFWALQQLSSLLLPRYLRQAGPVYGSFATVITILWWCYLQSLVTLLGAQLNAVLVERLHPRSLIGGPSTEADRRAYRAYTRSRTYRTDDDGDRGDGDG